MFNCFRYVDLVLIAMMKLTVQAYFGGAFKFKLGTKHKYCLLKDHSQKILPQ